MSPDAIALVAIAAFAHATWNVAVKRTGAGGVAFLWLTFLVGALVFAPFGVASLADAGVDLARWLGLAAVSGALQVGYFLLLQAGYRAGDVSVIYPLARGTGPLLSVVLAIVLLGERPGVAALVGAGVLVFGIVIIGLAGRGGDAIAASRSRARLRTRPDILFGLAIGVLIAVYTLWDSAAVTVGGMPAVGLYWGSLLFQVALAAPLALRNGARVTHVARSHPVAIVIVGVLAPLAYILVLLAVQVAPVSLVAPAREVSVVLVSLAGWILFREPRPAQRIAGSIVVLIGAAILAAG